MKNRPESEFIYSERLDIQKLIDKLPFVLDAASFGNKKTIIVEGTTDTRFLKSLPSSISDRLNVSTANVAFSSDGITTRKNSICEVIYSLEKVRPLYNFPEGAENWELYGMVDADSGINSKYKNLKHLIYGDTHDLETMLLSSDESLIDSLPISLNENEIEDAYFMAYQFDLIKEAAVNHSSLEVNGIHQTETISSLFDGCYLNVERCVMAFKANSPPGTINKNELERLVKNTYKDVYQINSKREWKISKEKFLHNLPVDFWQVVNGHDLCNMVRCCSKEAYDRYLEAEVDPLNRAFEIDLIKNYDNSNFVNTALYNSMVNSGLLKN